MVGHGIPADSRSILLLPVSRSFWYDRKIPMKPSQPIIKRLAVVAFAILYAGMVIGISASRTAAWIDAFAHRQSSGPTASLDKAKSFVPQVRHPRILQNHFVVEAPQVVSGALQVIDRHLDITPEFRPYGHSPLRLTSRAPPSLI